MPKKQREYSGSGNVFDSPEDKLEEIHKALDGPRDKEEKENVIDVAPFEDVFSETPMELKKVTENLTFIDKVRKHLHLIKEKNVFVEVFGVDKISLDSILMMNIWDRSILTTDTVSRMFLKMTLEQLKKYQPKKISKGFEYWWLIILLAVGGGALILIIIFLLPQLGNMKLF